MTAEEPNGKRAKTKGNNCRRNIFLPLGTPNSKLTVISGAVFFSAAGDTYHVNVELGERGACSLARIYSSYGARGGFVSQPYVALSTLPVRCPLVPPFLYSLPLRPPPCPPVTLPVCPYLCLRP